MSNQPPVTFEQVVEKYGDFVYNVALRMTSDPAEAEDVTQEAFIDAFRAWGRFRGESQVSTWLYRIAVNRSLMRRRKDERARQFTHTPLEEVQVVSPPEHGPEQAAINSELQKKLEDALRRLPQDLRSAVILRDVQGLSGEEAAEALSITLPALKARLHRGRLLLRDQLRDLVKSGGV